MGRRKKNFPKRDRRGTITGLIATLRWKLVDKRDGWVSDNPRYKNSPNASISKQEKKVFCSSLMFIWDSFWELSTTRHELGPIPWTAINEYAKRFNIDDMDEFDSFLFFIRGLDTEFLDIKTKEIQSKRDIDTTKTKSRKKRTAR
jgi:hypothetical protein